MKKQDLLKILDSIPQSRVAVIGDLMLDRYICGYAHRISQEAPVPVVRVERTNETPGGAANVAGNIISLGGHASIFGVIGKDAEGERLVSILNNRGADTDGIIVATDLPTTVKVRVIANHQQVVRIDTESSGELPEALTVGIEEKIIAGIASGKFQAVIFEDYAKGLLSKRLLERVIAAASTKNIYCALDPHPSHPFDVTGLQLMTPNRAEAFGLAGAYYHSTKIPLSNDQPLMDVGRNIKQKWQMDNLLVTLGGEGMALFANGDVTHIPTQAREVFDVSGAGDTVTATYVLAAIAGADPITAAHFSNYAAGLVVAKVGTTPVDPVELRELLEALDE